MSSDEYEGYDFSEFTADDLAAIDACIARAHGGPTIQIATPDSPLQRFRSRRKHLAVTDLVSPLWCEVQYEYSLYGKRYKPLSLRPSSFTSKSGKKIHVHQRVAHANDRTLKRGKSVHQALEDELRPVKLVVHAVSDEERFGLRLLQLIDGFNELVANGITRELPVFLIMQGQVILGVIDEVLRSVPTQGTQDQVVSPRSTPSAYPPQKKQRRSLSLTQQQTVYPGPELLTELSVVNTESWAEPTKEPTHAAHGCKPGDLYELQILDYKTRRSSNIPLDEDSLSPRIQLMMYHRMLSSLLKPEAFDFELLWNRLELDPTKSFSAQFLKDINWKQRVGATDCNVHLNRLVLEWTSAVERQRPGLIGISQQLQIVYRRSVFAGKQQEKGKRQGTVPVDRDDLLEALVPQEELDLARAIEESLSGMGYQEAGQVAGQVAQTVKQAGPSLMDHASGIWKDLISPLDSGQTDPALAWAIQQSLLTCARKARDQTPADNIDQTDTKRDNDPSSDEIKSVVIGSDEQVQKQDCANISPITGMKKFKMNDEELDRCLVDVLQWWLGARPARGVAISQTNRCFTCEYQDSCEWREQKAREAAAIAVERTRGQSCGAAPNFDM